MLIVEETTKLIATFYNIEPFLPAALKYPSRKIILITSTMDAKVKRNVKKLEEFFGSIVDVETVVMDEDAEVVEIAKKTVDLIDRESRPDARLIVSIGGGSRKLASGVLYGCYSRPKLVHKILSNSPSLREVIELPKLRYNLGAAKYEVLRKIANRGNKSINEIAKELHKTRGMLYQHLRELGEGGYVDDDFKITDAGRLALL
jgi:CRISPR locus-related DNA-binding protein